MKNETLLQKADAVLSDISGAGELSNQQAARFVRKVMEAPTLIRTARVIEMRSPRYEINKIGLGQRILRPAVENTGLAVGDRSKPTFEQVLLDAKEVIAELRLPYAMMEDAIERATIGQHRDAGGSPLSGPMVDTILSLIADATARDLEELALRGDDASGDPYLAQLNGWLKLSNQNDVNVASAKASVEMFADGLRAMPDKHKRELSRMRHYVSQNTEIDYREHLAARGTSLGDTVISNRQAVNGMGVPVQGVDLMPTAQGLLTDPRNLIFGMHRRVTMEFDKDISARVYKIVVTARVDFKIEETEAVVRYQNVG